MHCHYGSVIMHLFCLAVLLPDQHQAGGSYKIPMFMPQDIIGYTYVQDITGYVYTFKLQAA